MKISKIYVLFALVILASCSPSDTPSKELLEIEKIPGIERVRYTTSHPKDMTGI